MEPPSGPASRRHVPWNRLLLAERTHQDTKQHPSLQLLKVDKHQAVEVLHQEFGYKKIGQAPALTELTLCGEEDRQAERSKVCWQVLQASRSKGSREGSAISLLSFWTLPTTARLTVDTVPPLAAEGSVAVFNILEKEGLIIGYGWFRGNRIDQRAAIEAYQIINNSHTPGPSHTGRETIKPNGSLVIQSVKKQDAGTYTMITVKADLTNVSASGQLQVYSLLQQPSIQVSDPMVREKENKVVMTCITNEMDITIKWIFNKKQLKSAKNIFLSEDSENLTIDPIKKENAGDYQCEISNIGTSNRSETFELKVKENNRTRTVNTVLTLHP